MIITVVMALALMVLIHHRFSNVTFPGFPKFPRVADHWESAGRMVFLSDLETELKVNPGYLIKIQFERLLGGELTPALTAWIACPKNSPNGLRTIATATEIKNGTLQLREALKQDDPQSVLVGSVDFEVDFYETLNKPTRLQYLSEFGSSEWTSVWKVVREGNNSVYLRFTPYRLKESVQSSDLPEKITAGDGWKEWVRKSLPQTSLPRVGRFSEVDAMAE